MAKIKVHELAKEIGKSNRDVIDYLKAKGYDVVTAVNVVPESEIANIRAAFGAAPAASSGTSDSSKQEAAKQPKPVAPQSETDVRAEDDKPKKKGIVRVFRSQNASRQLQKRPPARKTAPASAASSTAARRENEAEQPLRPLVEVKEQKAEEMPALTAPEKMAMQESLLPEKNEKAEKKATAAEKPTVKTASDEVIGTNAEKSTAEEKPTEKSTAAVEKPAEKSAVPVEKPAEKTEPAETGGFRNGRVLRNVNTSPVRVPASSSLNGTAGRNSNDRNRGGQGRGMSDRNRSGQGRDMSQRQGQSQDRNRSGYQDRSRYGNGQEQQGDRSRGNYQNRQERPYSQSRTGGTGASAGGRGTGAPVRSYGTSGQGRPGQPASPAGGRVRGAAPGARPAPQAGGGDGALAHKTTRDFRKDGKERERNREERKELGKNQSQASSQKRQFNRTPKALQQKTPKAPQEKKVEVVTSIEIPEKISIRDLADAMKLKPTDLIKELFMKGEMVTLNHELTYEKAEEIAMEHDIECKLLEPEDPTEQFKEDLQEDREEDMVSRPPVICVMGHVDHGKTSLLDAIRNTHVTDREAGGITQHIGAYMVSVKDPESGEMKKLTFLDTPGHEAFTAMRMRGANATDIAVLVVAADDGVMPQTIEAINHAKAANTEIIVAVNKIDKPGANIDRVKQELSEYQLIAEDWGGETIFCPVSAKTQEGLENLLEMILLEAEMKELKANPNRNARGIVVEAKLDKGRGPVASVLIQKGTLHQGDFIACGAAYGKVRAMTDEKGKRLHKATPSMPVEIIGLSAVPEAGELFVVYDSDKEAKEHAAAFVTANKKTLLDETKTQMSLDDLFSQIKEGSLKELPIVVKADVQGSVEAVSQSLLKLSNDEVVVKVIHGGVGAINESDVSLAAASNAIIIGFNVRPDATAKMVADNQKVDIHLYNVIYEALEDVERALNGMRAAVYEEKIVGHAEIRAMFKSSGVGNIAGAYVKDGTFTRNAKVRVFRGEEKIFEGELASLKRFKDDVKEVREGFECGLVFKDFGGFQVDDMVEAYTMVEVPRT